MAIQKFKQHLSSNLPLQALIGGVFGVFAGITFGRYTIILKPIGLVYIMLLQAVVYPYLISTLMHGLGKISPSLLKRLFSKSWFYYIGFIIFIFATLMSLSIAIPHSIPKILTLHFHPKNPLPELLKLLIPENFFSALSFNYIPAVVIFSILFGLMLQQVKSKKNLLNIFETTADTCLVYWRWLTKFSPLALFILISATINQLEPSKIIDISVYFILFITGSLLLTFFAIPMLLASLTPIKYKEILSEMKYALIIVFSTTLSVMALPIILEYLRKKLKDLKIDDEDTNEITETTIIISYPLAQIGNFFIFLFIYFSLFYFSTEITPEQKFYLPLLTFFSCIGSPSTIINSIEFLTNWLKLPSDSIDVFFEFSALTRYFQVITSAMGIAFISIIATLAYYNKLQIKIKNIFLTLVTFFLIIGIIVYALSHMQPTTRTVDRNDFLSLKIDKKLKQSVHAVIIKPGQRSDLKSKKTSSNVLKQILDEKILRVGYNSEMAPFSFFNKDNELVGFDVAMVYHLAQALRIKLIFIPFEWKDLRNDIQQNKFDIAISFPFITPFRLKDVTYTDSLFKSKLVYLILRNNLQKFRDALKQKQMLSLAIIDHQAVIDAAKMEFHDVKFVNQKNYVDSVALLRKDRFDGIIINKELALAYTKIYPDLLILEKQGPQQTTPIAYVVNQHSLYFLSYLNQWLLITKTTGLRKQLYDKWVLGNIK